MFSCELTRGGGYTSNRYWYGLMGMHLHRQPPPPRHRGQATMMKAVARTTAVFGFAAADDDVVADLLHLLGSFDSADDLSLICSSCSVPSTPPTPI